MDILIGIMIPFFGTLIGAFLVFFVKKELSKKIENIIYGFAAGVMMAALIWSLIIPSIENSTNVLPVIIGLVIGTMLFLFIDKYTCKYKNYDNLVMSISVHNFPEGVAVGIALASYLSGGLSLPLCYTLAIGIGIQNIPEGSIISIPLLKKGFSKKKAFFYGFLSGLFELMGAILALLFTRTVTSLYPYLLSFAAGAMLYVVVGELIPESSESSKKNVIGFLIGFIIMMVLDVILG